MATSALLIALGREANGTVRAHWDDWPGMALNALLLRGLIFIGWGLILAGVVKLLQRAGVHEDEEPDRVRSAKASPVASPQESTLVSLAARRLDPDEPAPRRHRRREHADRHRARSADADESQDRFGSPRR